MNRLHRLAVTRGLTVIGTANDKNQDYVRSLGAIPVVYGDGLVARVRAVAPQGVNAALDASGHDALPASIELTGGTERVVTLADPQAEKYHVRFSSAPERSTEALKQLVKAVSDGSLKVRVAQTFPLAQAAEAHRASESTHAPGKLVLLVD